jgi:6-phosphogluconolactonase
MGSGVSHKSRVMTGPKSPFVLRRSPTAGEAAEACGRHVLVLLEDALAAGARPTLAISGGYSPMAMFLYFAQAEFPWDRVHIFWVDERGVPPTDSQSNYRLARETWLVPARVPETNVHRIFTELGPQEAERMYQDDIRAFFKLEKGGLPHFEVIHRGMGPDAHTASLFPGESKIKDHHGIAASVWPGGSKQWRVTLLPGALEAARHTVILATGGDKATALDAVLRSDYDPKKYPAQLASRREHGAVWFVDEAAAAKIPPE